MTTLAVMKARIADEFRRDDLTDDIANAISTSIDIYKYQRFSFNASSFKDAPAADDEANNVWMTTAERLIRARAKLEIVLHVLDQPDPTMAANLKAEIDDAIVTLRETRSNLSTVTADTLGAMKKRIANEINRSDLDDQIADAIVTAIKAYQDVRFWFNETRSFTFTTVADQDIYTSSDDADIGNIQKIDYLKVDVGSYSYTLVQQSPEWFDAGANTASNIPGFFGFYDESIRLYPVPSEAYTVRVACVEKVAVPASDTEANNPWMIQAEALIRCRAKAELYSHIDDIADDKKAMKFSVLAQEALDDLDRKTARLTRNSRSLVRAFQ